VIITVTLEDGQLMAQTEGQDAVPLFPTSETHFYMDVVPGEVEFELDEQGRVTGFTLDQAGRSIHGKRKE
jgi:hypothetical protein